MTHQFKQLIEHEIARLQSIPAVDGYAPIGMSQHDYRIGRNRYTLQKQRKSMLLRLLTILF